MPARPARASSRAARSTILAGELARDVRRNERDRGSCQARYPERLADRLGPHGGEPLDGFARQPRNSVEDKIRRNRVRLLPAEPLDGLLLAAEVTFVPVSGLKAAEIHQRILDLERQLAARREHADVNVRLSKRAARGYS